MEQFPGNGVGTLNLLTQIATILGTTKQSFWPVLSMWGQDIFPHGAGSLGAALVSSDETGPKEIWSEFDPGNFDSGIHSLHFQSSVNNHLNGGDNNGFSFTDGANDDAPFSVGLWMQLDEALGTTRTLMAKYGSTANLEEWDFRIDTSGNLVLELHDASASASEIGTGASDIIVPHIFQFVVATYDGAQDTPEVHLYRNGVDTLAAGTTTESGAYVGMENTAAGLLVGARDATGTPAQEFEGDLALPFVTGKELTAAEVAALHGLGQQLLGI